MSAKIRFTSATATGLVLAKVGHPQRDEPLQTSKEVFKIEEKDQEALSAIFLKPFKNLTAHRFSHHASLEQHEMNAYASAIFASDDGLLEKGCEIAKRLYAKSNHPNIKSGDLCISLIKDIDVDGQLTQGLCILKSESVVPFLSISTRDGDLELHTEQGINPEKIDKGCLIINHLAAKGYYVLTFDRSGTDSRFWVRDFLGVVPITDSPFLTNKYANMAVAFMEKEKKENPKASAPDDDAPPWDTSNAARDAITYFEEKEKFSLQEFEEQVLKTPEAKAKFAEHRSKVEEEQGHRLEDTFEISKKDVTKAKNKIKTVMKLDTGAEVRLKPALAAKPDAVLEHGFDEGRKMKFIKIYFNEDLAE
ncbi:nucleoid-associated protein [Luteolibacter yonseiensis]|uniref:Nucleoid-associated protein n=1 Tax=Luteolibacter yonseiensis TaxID=1144680 RepID=A0A934R9D2_9BACT|nr:nucleoid-associated protein [Luteolibacter yonseiensis]MBK1817444.1 nucleoid-associated protein [Luteolibacter yonseiensis]